MNKKIVVQFVILTFIIRLIFGGVVAVFAVETSAYNYLFVVALFIAYIVSMVVASGLNKVNPKYMFFIWMIGSLLAGAGMEEAGWRYILQYELNKKFGYLL